MGLAGVALIAVVMAAALPGLRPAREIAGGAIGSILMAVLVQALSVPVVIAVGFVLLLVADGLGLIGPPTGGRLAPGIFGAMTASIVLFVVISVAAYIVGWGVGRRLAGGLSVREALRGSRMIRMLAAGSGRLLPPLRQAAPESAFGAAMAIIVIASVALLLARYVYVWA
jgi:hypothetical protein